MMCSSDLNFFDQCIAKYRQLIHPTQPTANLFKIGNENELKQVPWNWLCLTLMKLLENYPSGLTEAIILNELQNIWDNYILGTWNEMGLGTMERKMVNVMEVYNRGNIPFQSVLEAKIENIFQVPNTSTYLLSLVDESFPLSIEYYLHQNYYHLTDKKLNILKKDRVIRLTGCVFAPYKFDNLANKAKLRLLPTPFMSIQLNESEDYLMSEISNTKLTSLSPNTIVNSIFAKVTQIFPVTQTKDPGKHKKQKISITDFETPKPVTLVLYDDHTIISSLFKIGDSIRVENVLVSNQVNTDNVVIEYTQYSVLYVLNVDPLKDAKVSSQSKLQKSPTLSMMDLLPLDPYGKKDVRYYPEKIQIKDLTEGISGLTLLGRIEAIGRNSPITFDGKISDRFPLKLRDSLNQTIDITFWEHIGCELITKHRVGQLVIIEGLHTIKSKTDNRKFYVIAVDGETRIHSISTCLGLLSSTSLYQGSLMDLSYCVETQLKNFIVKARILSYSSKDEIKSKLTLIHSFCKRLVKSVSGTIKYECNFCASQNIEQQNTEKIFHFAWTIQDSISKYSIQAMATSQVHFNLLQITPEEFESLSFYNQNQKLNKLIECEFIFSICLLADGLYRIDQVVESLEFNT